MASKMNIDADSVVPAIFAGVVAANALSAYYLSNPFLYCWFREGAWVVYQSVGPAMLVISLAALGYGLLTRKFVTAGVALLAFMVVNNMPLLAVKFFGLGVACV